jgi:hypothetical protein
MPATTGLTAQDSARRGRRADAGSVRLSGRDAAGLLLCAEHYAAPYDLLAAASGVQPARLRGIVARRRAAGYARTGTLRPGPVLCWVTSAGMTACGPARRACRRRPGPRCGGHGPRAATSRLPPTVRPLQNPDASGGASGSRMDRPARPCRPAVAEEQRVIPPPPARQRLADRPRGIKHTPFDTPAPARYPRGWPTATG